MCLQCVQSATAYEEEKEEEEEKPKFSEVEEEEPVCEKMLLYSEAKTRTTPTHLQNCHSSPPSPTDTLSHSSSGVTAADTKLFAVALNGGFWRLLPAQFMEAAQLTFHYIFTGK